MEPIDERYDFRVGDEILEIDDVGYIDLEVGNVYLGSVWKKQDPNRPLDDDTPPETRRGRWRLVSKKPDPSNDRKTILRFVEVVDS